MKVIYEKTEDGREPYILTLITRKISSNNLYIYSDWGSFHSEYEAKGYLRTLAEKITKDEVLYLEAIRMFRD